jgi:predicted O-linked N-acetylglucosamine transferase (SPINDLY family)
VAPSPETPKRSDFGLPEEGFVFCSFNHDYKINPPMFKIWMDLLKEVPGSVLWLMKLNEAAQANLTKEAIRHGVDPARLVYATRVPRVEDHLARYRLADLFIDTFPYNGHTTAGDALRAGLPVISVCGESLASRVAMSILNDIGIPELCCSSMSEYYKKILKIATDKDGVTPYRVKLKNKLENNIWPLNAKSQAIALALLLSAKFS